MSARVSLEAWKDITLTSYCRKNFMGQTTTSSSTVPPRSLMNSIPPFWTIELTRNGVLEDSFDSSESLFCALPPVDDPALPPSITNGCYDAEDRDLVRRLISDYDFFFNSERGARAFQQLVLRQRLFPQDFMKKRQQQNESNAPSSTSIITNPVRDHVFVGKSETALIKLENPSVSRIHCVIFLGVENEIKVNKLTNREESQPVCSCYVVDLASSNGTFLILPKTSATAAANANTSSSNPQQHQQMLSSISFNQNNSHQQPGMLRLTPGVPTKLPDGATIRCGTSSVAITVQCAAWADRLLRQKEDEEFRRQQQLANNNNIGGRIRQRQDENDGDDLQKVDEEKNSNNTNKFIISSTSNDDASTIKILNLRKLSLETLRMRQQQMRMEIATRTAGSSSHNDNNGIAALQNELRDVEFVLNEKIQQQLARSNNSNTSSFSNGSVTNTIVEIIEEIQ